VHLADDRNAWDRGCSGLELLPASAGADAGTFAATTHGPWGEGAPPQVICARFTLAELEALAGGGGR
jgi:hypothetical protein